MHKTVQAKLHDIICRYSLRERSTREGKREREREREGEGVKERDRERQRKRE